MKLVVGAAFALGVVLGGGQTLATNLVADDVSSVDESTSPDPDDQTDEPTDSADDEGTDDSTDDEADEAESGEDPAEPEDAADDPAAVNYGHLVSAWLDCVKGLEAVTDCGDRPHPPGVATGWDAAHAKGHAAKHEAKEHPANEHATKGDDGKAHKH